MHFSKSTLHKVNRVIEVARALKPIKGTGKPFHVTACYRKNRLVSIGCNDYRHFHPEKRFGKYHARRCNNAEKYIPGRHSEIAAIMQAREDDFSDITFINVRINNNDEVDMSKPCENCMRVLCEQLDCKQIIYTKKDGELGLIKP